MVMKIATTGTVANTDQYRLRAPVFASRQASSRCVVSWSRPDDAM